MYLVFWWLKFISPSANKNNYHCERLISIEWKNKQLNTNHEVYIEITNVAQTLQFLYVRYLEICQNSFKSYNILFLLLSFLSTQILKSSPPEKKYLLSKIRNHPSVPIIETFCSRELIQDNQYSMFIHDSLSSWNTNSGSKYLRDFQGDNNRVYITLNKLMVCLDIPLQARFSLNHHRHDSFNNFLAICHCHQTQPLRQMSKIGRIVLLCYYKILPRYPHSFSVQNLISLAVTL